MPKDRNEEKSGFEALIEKIVDAATDEDGAKFKKALFACPPYAVFAMMPLFALFLKILYLGSGKRYGEHLLCALDTNAFAFLMLTLILRMPAGIPFAGKLLFLWLAFYLPIAIRRVYGGSRKLTALRWGRADVPAPDGLAVAIAGTVGIGASH